MKLLELLNGSGPFAEMKQLNSQFRALAADNNITIIAGMGWPQQVKNGAWFGGGLNKKGRTGKHKNDIFSVDDLSAEAKEKFNKLNTELFYRESILPFLTELAKKLEELIVSGRTVMLSTASRAADGVIAVKAGEALDKLQTTIKVMQPPGRGKREMLCITWFIEESKENAGKMAIRLETMIGSYDNNKRVSLDIGATIDAEKAKKIFKNFSAWRAHNGSDAPYYDAPDDSTSAATPVYLEFRKKLMRIARKYGLDAPNDALEDSANYTIVKLKTLTKKTIVISPDEMLDIFKPLL